ncbi:ABC-F family ATP-binding cassette domain-containing protein [Actinotignum sp. GS-2025f]|uniref:ABC-F family ATP-binding cassette domain-containing protein n=1 Tax=Actinotignum TaxID=1653174 RepID=UPI00254AFE83|nr:ABC-F family ATP-binding cassette domain-containing protein [Actinotignum sanguinis]MDK6787650.1 ABC-F family ATP-binding cassette domain-containing protein [Actinotignum timonense]MDK8285988.1 ABC-F family ATP-binding cassette domain-containing protein [Actinotignum sanguinis]MDK8650491.1 ABC-F family ATP-binding cassette domain-containing protein [Actinotignum sanguinis]MDK8800840.1 ABC-F family ATP-binding cassette domain-containing protein [Actinotignum sanguinis]
MAHLLSVHDVGVSLGSSDILSNVSLSLEDGSRIGVVGPNGGGKTTLLRLITGRLAPTSGEVIPTNTATFATLTQADELPDTTVLEAIHAGTARHEWASDARVRDLHAGLLPDIPLQARVRELSGGQRRRVALAHTLTREANIIILDEPTNHLDVEGITFLAHYIKERFGGPRPRGALVAVTHDRWFLDAVATRLWEVVPGVEGPRGQIPGRVETYEGGYSDYIFQRAERERQAALAEEKRNNLLRKELAWLRRGAPARTSKPRFRIEAAENLIADVPAPRDTVEMTRMAASRLGKEVVNLEDVSLRYGVGPEILRGVTWRIAPGERVGILGANGAGKSSLLALIAGRLEPTTGHVKRGTTVKLAELSQHTRELDEVADLRVVEAVNDVAARVQVGKKELTASQVTERMGFTRERAWTRVSELSGGERRRLQFMRLLMAEPNVLLLDEPTNDLDTDTLAAMEDVLDGWPGTLIVVSHDRYLLERMTDRQIAVLDGHVRDLPGGVDQYLRLREQEREEREGAGGVSNSGAAPAPSGAGSEKSASALQREARKEVQRIEKRMNRLREQIAKLEERSAACAVSGDYEELARIGKELSEASGQLDELEEQWLEAAEIAEG